MRQTAVLVVRPDGRFSESLRENGCEVVNLELIKTEQIADLSELVETIHQIERYDGIFLTSPVAAEIFFRHLTSESRKFTGKVYALGERVKVVLARLGLNVTFSATANTAQDLIESIDQVEFAGKRLLFIRGDRSVRTIPEMLGGIALVDEVVVYKTVEISTVDNLIEDVKVRLETDEIDWACFFSPSGVDSFMARFDGEDVAKVKAAVIGETTARRANEVGLDVAFVSKNANAEDFAAGLAAFIKNIE